VDAAEATFDAAIGMIDSKEKITLFSLRGPVSSESFLPQRVSLLHSAVR
jgi:hypothetical protein